MATKFITFFELTDYGVPRYSRKHLIDMQREGKFPKARQLSPNRIGWDLREIEAWLASRPIGKNYREPEADDAAA
jgi:predicted DNA-binding transcriptional regulator AlpA